MKQILNYLNALAERWLASLANISLLLLMAQHCHAQTWAAVGSDGTQYEFSELLIPNAQLYPPTPMMGGGDDPSMYYCEAGYFRLYFEAGSALYGEGTASEYRAVFCALFNDLSQFLISDLDENAEFVNIYISDDIDQYPNATTGYDVIQYSSVFTLPENPSGVLYDEMIILDSELWKTIISGHDSFNSFADPLDLSNYISNDFYHAFLYVSFDPELVDWNTNFSANTPSNQLDMYSVALQKVTHLLGIESFFQYYGGNYSFPAFTRYDTFLEKQNGTNLISPWYAECPMGLQLEPLDYFAEFNPGCPCDAVDFFDCDVFDDTECLTAIHYNGSVNLPVYTSNCFQKGISLVTFEDACYEGNVDDQYFVMTNGILTGIDGQQRFYTEEERAVLCDLGYTVGASFNGHVYSESLCTVEGIAGMNDGINSDGEYTLLCEVGGFLDIDILLDNDGLNASEVTCVEMITDYASVQVIGNQIKIFPTECGVHVFRYVPVSTDGFAGNITYCFVFSPCFPGCLSQPCELISNGGFEAATYDWLLNTYSGTLDEEYGIMIGQEISAPHRYWNALVECSNVVFKLHISMYGIIRMTMVCQPEWAHQVAYRPVKHTILM
ncbi:MAG: hypothetical protein ACKVOK_17105 [Flavobacteriales bacterium]